MKKLIALFAAGLSLAAFAPSEAQARPHGHGGCSSHQRVVGHCGHCRQPIISYQRVVGYDCQGYPIVRWVTARHTACEHAARQRQRSSCGQSSHYDRGYSYRGGRGHSSHHSSRSSRSHRPPLPHEIIGRIFGRR